MNEIQPSPKRSILARIFVSSGELRLRAGWRLLAQTLIMVVLIFMVGLAIFIPAAFLKADLNNMALGQVAELAAITGSVFLVRKFLDRRTITSIGLKLDRLVVIDILVGILITFIQMGVIYLAMVVLGWSKFESFAWQAEPLNYV